MKYISNSFSPKMLNPKTNPGFEIKNSSYEEIKKEHDLISSIGHDNIAEHIGIKKNRINIQLEEGDILYVVQVHNDEKKKPHYTYKKITITL